MKIKILTFLLVFVVSLFFVSCVSTDTSTPSSLNDTTQETFGETTESKIDSVEETSNDGADSKNLSNTSQSDDASKNAAIAPKEGELLLGGKLYTKEEIASRGGISSWYCTDWDNPEDKTILMEFGYFNDDKEHGFILYNGTQEGVEEEVYHRKDGTSERWNWAVDKNNYFEYSFIIDTKEIGYYYRFPLDKYSAKPQKVYIAKKR